MCQHFPKHHGLFRGNIKIELGLSNYATKHDARKAKCVNTSSMAEVTLAGLKLDVVTLSIDTLKTVPTQLIT